MILTGKGAIEPCVLRVRLLVAAELLLNGAAAPVRSSIAVN